MIEFRPTPRFAVRTQAVALKPAPVVCRVHLSYEMRALAIALWAVVNHRARRIVYAEPKLSTSNDGSTSYRSTKLKSRLRFCVFSFHLPFFQFPPFSLRNLHGEVDRPMCVKLTCALCYLH